MKRLLLIMLLTVMTVAYVLLAAEVRMPLWLFCFLASLFFGGLAFFFYYVRKASVRPPVHDSDTRTVG
jgi:uncharacterized membrane protein YjjP (DUF1212 family)